MHTKSPRAARRDEVGAGKAVAMAMREEGWAAVFVVPEAGAFALWPLGFLFSQAMRRNTFWSDGQDFIPDVENPPAIGLLEALPELG